MNLIPRLETVIWPFRSSS